MTEELLNWFKSWYEPVTKIFVQRLEDFDFCNNFERSENDTFPTQSEINSNFYKIFKSWKLEWNTKGSLNIKARGSIEIIPLEKTLSNSWEKDFGAEDWAPDMKGFRPLDMFFDMDGMVGFFIGRPDKKGLYLMHSDSSLSPLHLDFNGYLGLLSMSKGFGWWQNAIVEINTGEKMPNVDSFKEKMPKLFPDFSWEAFVEKYQELRLK